MPIAHFSVLPRELGHKFIESRPFFRATGVVEQFIPLSPNKILPGEALGRHLDRAPPVPEWKIQPDIIDALPEDDPARKV